MRPQVCLLPVPGKKQIAFLRVCFSLQKNVKFSQNGAKTLHFFEGVEIIMC